MGFATFGGFSFYRQKKVADYEYHSLYAESNLIRIDISSLKNNECEYVNDFKISTWPAAWFFFLEFNLLDFYV